jgi:hypothetical protein
MPIKAVQIEYPPAHRHPTLQAVAKGYDLSIKTVKEKLGGR